jgi:hypothetical protein
VYKFRQWSVDNSRRLEAFYRTFESTLVWLHPLFNRIGYQRLEKPVRFFERAVKKTMFDCQMCGKCVLSSTGMSCPMNCPKSIRNGPCGGVRLDGSCEVRPEMRCVWVEAWRGSQKMVDAAAIGQVQIPVNYLLKDTSSWLRVVRHEHAAQRSEAES